MPVVAGVSPSVPPSPVVRREEILNQLDFSGSRSVLYVPGDLPRKLGKAARLASYGLILDWEDAVAKPSR